MRGGQDVDGESQEACKLVSVMYPARTSWKFHKTEGETVPEFEEALSQLTIDELLAEIRASGGGVAAGELIKHLGTQGIPPKVAMMVLHSQIDAGRVRLGKRMRLVAQQHEPAA